MIKSFLFLPETQSKPTGGRWRQWVSSSNNKQLFTLWHPWAGLNQLGWLGSCFIQMGSSPSPKASNPQEAGGAPDVEIKDYCEPGFASDVGVQTSC